MSTTSVTTHPKKLERIATTQFFFERTQLLVSLKCGVFIKNQKKRTLGLFSMYYNVLILGNGWSLVLPTSICMISYI